MQMTLGIDVACRAAHQASLADESGRFAWSGRRFRTASADLQQLWDLVPPGASVTVVMEPTRNAWVPLAAWFRRRGAAVIMVPPEQSADLRDYYSKHVKSDRLDSRILARRPLLHPDGLRPAEGLGPAEALRRAVKLRASLVKRRTMIVARLDSYLELLGPQWHAALGSDLTLYTPLRFLAAGYADPHAARRLGKARLTRFIWRYSHGAWGKNTPPRSWPPQPRPCSCGMTRSATRTWPRTSPPKPAWPWRSAPRSGTWMSSSPRCCTRPAQPAS